MDYNEFYAYCEQIFDINSLLPKLNKSKVEKLYKLTEHMLEVNKSMNLTAIKDEKAVILKHYADSLLISQYISENAKIIDIGCGAGFPSLPLAIFRPDLQITALDSTSKRIDYVALTAKMLGLDNVTAIAARAEELAHNTLYRERFDFVTARAVASLPVLTELCLPFVKVDGSFVAMKAQKASEEINASANAIAKCGGTIDCVFELALKDIFGDPEVRSLIVINKVGRTPKELPRLFSKISKKPL